jgi:hypothetical protein
MTAKSKIITATLIRGRFYAYGNVHFYRNEPLTVSEDLADELEELADEVKDNEGESFSKPRFKIDRDAGNTLQTSASKDAKKESKAPVIRKRRASVTTV